MLVYEYTAEPHAPYHGSGLVQDNLSDTRIRPYGLGGGSFVVSPIECCATQPASLMLISQFDQSNVSASVRFAALVIPPVDVFGEGGTVDD
jgi:hypothetical protein